MHDATLCFLLEDGHIHLAMKKRGFGKGKFNGYGGKPENGETVEQAAIRELREETGGVVVASEHLKKVGEIDFYFPHVPKEKDFDQTVHIYIARKWLGEPKESEEMKPQKFSFSDIPYDSMWADDKHWLPKVLNGECFKGIFVFGKDDGTIDKYELKTVDSL